MSQDKNVHDFFLWENYNINVTKTNHALSEAL
jgi:hypothetical protein